MQFPRYSPDLNPLDYSIWHDVNARIAKSAPARLESVKAYKARLRRTAMRLPEAFVRKTVLSLPKRIRQAIAAEGGNIPRD